MYNFLVLSLLTLLASFVVSTHAIDNHASGESRTDNISRASLQTVALQKQYVPMKADGKVIAYKASYFGTIYAGTPARPFTAVFDTGSGHLILPSTSCGSKTCRKHRRFNRLASSTAVDIDFDGSVIGPEATERDQVTIAFGTGEVLGEFVKDKVCFEKTQQEVCVNLRIVAAADMADEPFGLFDFDGVLGLGLTPLTLDAKFSFFGQMIEQHPEMKPQFAVFLAPYDGGMSSISFGGYDQSLTTSDIRWVPVANPDLGYWQVNIKSVRIGETLLEECADGSCHAILDSGTSLLGVPREVLRKMHRTLARPVGKEYPQVISEIDCRMIPGLEMHFDLGDQVITLGVEDYSRPTPFNMTYPEAEEGWRMFCRSLLLPLDMDEPLSPRTFIFGEPVLRRYYSVYDVAKKQIGFSKARELPEGTMGLPVLGAPPAGTRISGVGVPLPKSQPMASVV